MFKRISVYFAIISMCFTAFANTELTYWFNDGALQNTTSCESGDDIIAPNAPYKYGYRFTGWEPAQTYDFSTLNSNINPTTYSSSDDIFYVSFSYGIVILKKICSNTASIQDTTGSLPTSSVEPAISSSGVYTYCKVIAFKPANESKIYIPVQELPWVYSRHGYNKILSNCQNKGICSASGSVFWSTLYGIN